MSWRTGRIAERPGLCCSASFLNPTSARFSAASRVRASFAASVAGFGSVVACLSAQQHRWNARYSTYTVRKLDRRTAGCAFDLEHNGARAAVRFSAFDTASSGSCRTGTDLSSVHPIEYPMNGTVRVDVMRASSDPTNRGEALPSRAAGHVALLPVDWSETS